MNDLRVMIHLIRLSPVQCTFAQGVETVLDGLLSPFGLVAMIHQDVRVRKETETYLELRLVNSAEIHTYWGHHASVVGLLPPLPLSCDLCPRDELEPLPDIGITELEGDDSVGVEHEGVTA